MQRRPATRGATAHRVRDRVARPCSRSAATGSPARSSSWSADLRAARRARSSRPELLVGAQPRRRTARAPRRNRPSIASSPDERRSDARLERPASAGARRAAPCARGQRLAAPGSGRRTGCCDSASSGTRLLPPAPARVAHARAHAGPRPRRPRTRRHVGALTEPTPGQRERDVVADLLELRSMTRLRPTRRSSSAPRELLVYDPLELAARPSRCAPTDGTRLAVRAIARATQLPSSARSRLPRARRARLAKRRAAAAGLPAGSSAGPARTAPTAAGMSSRASACRPASPSSAAARRRRATSVRSSVEPELGAVAIRLLEVVADDLVVVAEARLAGVAPGARRRSSRGARRAPPSGCPRTLRRGSASGGTAYVSSPGTSARTGLTRPFRTSDMSAPRRRRLVLVGREVGDRAAPELLPDDRGPLQQPALGGLEPVDAGPRGVPGSRPGARLASAGSASAPRSSPRAARRRAGCPRRSTRSGHADPRPRRRARRRARRLAIRQLPELELRGSAPSPGAPRAAPAARSQSSTSRPGRERLRCTRRGRASSARPSAGPRSRRAAVALAPALEEPPYRPEDLVVRVAPDPTGRLVTAAKAVENVLCVDRSRSRAAAAASSPPRSATS